MCILFVYNAKQGSTIRFPFKLILATNRDESYSRPSKIASFWENPDSNILGGRDMQSGGTWLGMNKVTGKIALLLNIMGGTNSDLKSTRGSLTSDFLRSPKHLTGWTYCKNLVQDPDLDIFSKFSQFNLVTFDLLEDDMNNPDQHKKSRLTSVGLPLPHITYLTNHSSSKLNPDPIQITTNYFAVGNSPLSQPFQKVIAGTKIFEEIVNSTNSISKEQLKTQLLQFLKSTQKHYPDDQLLKQGQGKSEDVLKGLSSIFVQPEDFSSAYGTRTRTIILVDNDNNVDFEEWSSPEPPNIKNSN